MDDQTKTITVSLNSIFSSKNPDEYWKETISKVLTLFHESFIHVNLYAGDFIDDGKKNYSNIPENIKNAASGMQTHYQHFKVGMEQNEGNNLWPQQAFNAMKNINKSFPIPVLYKTNSELWKTMWDYSGGAGFEKW